MPSQLRVQVPDYLGLGTPEDSLASHLNLRPKPPRKDTVNYIVNANKYLRYSCVLQSPVQDDRKRRFILKYRLSDDTITIVELPLKNSGILGGRFVSSQRVWKPHCDPRLPDYYTAKDLLIGTTIVVNCHRFTITAADLFVYQYMCKHPELFNREAIDNIRAFHIAQGNIGAEAPEGQKSEEPNNQNLLKEMPRLSLDESSTPVENTKHVNFHCVASSEN